MASVGDSDRVDVFNRDLSPYFQASEDLPELPSGLKDVDGSGYKKYDADIRAWWTSMRENLDRLQDAMVHYKILDLDEKHSDLNSDAITSLNAASIGLNAAITNEATTAAAATAAVQADVNQNESDADAAIAAVQADVDQNESDADAAIAAVQADVDQNELDADTAIAAVQTDVNNNESDADSAISTNASAISSNTSAITLNTTHRGVSSGNPHSVTKTEVGLGSVANVAAIPATDLIDEDAMGSNSATKVPSQQSVKAYVDTQVVSAAGVIEVHYAVIRTLSANQSTNHYAVHGFNPLGWSTSMNNLNTYGSGLNPSGGYGGPSAANGDPGFVYGADVDVYSINHDATCPFILRTITNSTSGTIGSFGQIEVPVDGGTWILVSQGDPGGKTFHGT